MKVYFKKEPDYLVPKCCRADYAAGIRYPLADQTLDSIELRDLIFENLLNYRYWEEDYDSGDHALSIVERTSEKMADLINLLVEKNVLELNDVLPILGISTEMVSRERHDS